MAILLAGFVVFFATHLSPGVFGLRPVLVERLGENRFRGLYIALSVLGMVGIIVGKSTAGYVTVYFPPVWAMAAVPMLLALACIFLAAFVLPSNFRSVTRHPMLWGITLWAIGHLLANGDLASIIMFGGFAAYSLISMWSLNSRGAKKTSIRYSGFRDIVVVVAGLFAYALLAWLHPYVIGVPASL